jgi:hypothetical protein
LHRPAWHCFLQFISPRIRTKPRIVCNGQTQKSTAPHPPPHNPHARAAMCRRPRPTVKSHTGGGKNSHIQHSAEFGVRNFPKSKNEKWNCPIVNPIVNPVELFATHEKSRELGNVRSTYINRTDTPRRTRSAVNPKSSTYACFNVTL